MKNLQKYYNEFKKKDFQKLDKFDEHIKFLEKMLEEIKNYKSIIYK